MPHNDPSAIARWRTARRLTLGAIVVAGTMFTAAAVAQRVAEHPCHASARVDSYYTYSGIGVELTQEGDHFVVSRVFRGTPADGKIYPGAVLLEVDGQAPSDMLDWTRAIRGDIGSSVELEVVYPCQGHELVSLERALVRVRH
ncbi:hypothetical protein G6O69_16915 [Pseudenhygromyxa sp. WMMC2535]|uniref:PDZ domain-containing protein n=1 Tax=Pseudenhygromyxa sp. WMMC2535 TaxID=2712867 RepID=UPI00159574B4|nr:PDZ domain-containing protein [Pseudenhygromyxa sp. WMMC2535]NVB39526.1 hypothetical protein [Pseudenhygromyxa sp. WMMC2535]